MRSALLVALLASLAACSTTITISSEPAGARLFVDGVLSGVTPCQIERSNPSGPEAFLVRLDFAGHESAQQLVQAVPNGTVTASSATTTVQGTSATTATGTYRAPQTYGTYGARRTPTYTGTENTVTVQDAFATSYGTQSSYLVYAWPRRVHLALKPDGSSSAPAPAAVATRPVDERPVARPAPEERPLPAPRPTPAPTPVPRPTPAPTPTPAAPPAIETNPTSKTTFCTACGARFAGSEKFCTSCGSGR